MDEYLDLSPIKKIIYIVDRRLSPTKDFNRPSTPNIIMDEPRRVIQNMNFRILLTPDTRQ